MSSGHLKNPHHASCSESGPNRPAARNLRVDKSREIDLLLDQNERQGLCLATKDRCLRKALLTRACAGMLVSPAPASSLGHLTGTASRPAPNPSISITRAGILRFSFQDVLDTALFNHMLEVFGIPRDHKPLVRIPPLLLPVPGPQADFDELAPVDVYGI